MARIAYYREWRPQTFDEVVAQEQVVFPLRQSVVKGAIGHAYLFSGTRGTGKTSLARIYAKAVNCLDIQDGNPCNKCEICVAINEGTLLDVIEMDAASHNSVENIRRMADEVLFAPVYARYKVYIIDEVHMLSGGAFNALLKTLEEPPAHAIFILATTEPHRIPATIISRCQRYDFRRIPQTEVTKRLRLIADSYDIDIADDALITIAALAEGTLRDAISLLDQSATGIEGRITRDSLLNLVGLVDDDFLAEMAEAIITKQVDKILLLVEQLTMSGRDLTQAVIDLARYLRNVLICQISRQPERIIQVTARSLEKLILLSKQIKNKALIDLIQGLSSLLNELRWTPDMRTSLEIGLMRLVGEIPQSTGVDELPSIDEGESLMSEHSTRVASLTANEAETTSVESVIEPDTKAVEEETTGVEAAIEPDAKTIEEETTGVEAVIEPDTKAVEKETTGVEAVIEPDTKADEKEEDSDKSAITEPISSDNLLEHNQLLSHWQKVLDQLIELGHIDILIMARSSHVSYDGSNWYLNFDSSMQAQYERCSMPDAIRLLSTLVSQEMEQSVAVIARFAQDEEVKSGATAEPEWLNRVRKVCQETDVPLKVEE